MSQSGPEDEVVWGSLAARACRHGPRLKRGELQAHAAGAGGGGLAIAEGRRP